MYTSLLNNFQYICDIYITFVSWPPWDVSQLFGRHSDLAARPVVFVIPLRLTPNSTITNVAAFRTRTVSPGPWPRAPLVDRFLRKANIKLMRPPVRYVDNRVEIILQQLARIGFQVAQFAGFVKLVVVIAGRVEIEGSAAISFLVSGRSSCTSARADCRSKSLGSDSFT